MYRMEPPQRGYPTEYSAERPNPEPNAYGGVALTEIMLVLVDALSAAACRAQCE